MYLFKFYFHYSYSASWGCEGMGINLFSVTCVISRKQDVLLEILF